jgi:AcrR family transcriptional regulator
MSDKPETRQRLLEAACDVFARHGYRDATVQDICTAAGANGAAVNYYFGGKQKLYLAAWEFMYDTGHRQHVDRIRRIVDPRKRLREIVFQRVSQVFDDGPDGRFRRVIHSEVNNPTDMHAEIRERFLRSLMEVVTETVAALLGRRESDPLVRRCAFSLQSQLVSLARLRFKADSRVIPQLLGTPAPDRRHIDELAEHIVAFVMGGIQAVNRGTRKTGVKAQKRRRL